MSNAEVLDRPFENTSLELLKANLRSLIHTSINGRAKLAEETMGEEATREVLKIVDSAERIAIEVLDEMKIRIGA